MTTLAKAERATRLRFCPNCGDSGHWRSRRRGLEILLGWVNVYPYRCTRCYERFLSAGRRCLPSES